jgi:hypothetical protein
MSGLPISRCMERANTPARAGALPCPPDSEPSRRFTSFRVFPSRPNAGISLHVKLVRPLNSERDG